MRQVAVGSVNLDAIEPSSLRVTGCGSIVINRTNNFLFCHPSRKRRLDLNGVPAVVDCVDDLFPTASLSIGINAGRALKGARRWRHVCGFRNDKGCRGTLRVVGGVELSRNSPRLAGSTARHRCDRHAMRQRKIIQVKRREKVPHSFLPKSQVSINALFKRRGMQSKTFDRLIRSKDPNVLFNTNFPSGSLPAFVIQTGCLSLGVLVSKGLRSTKVYGFDIHKLADA